MAEMIKMFAPQLEDLIVKDVRRHAHCTAFKSITVHKIAEGQIHATVLISAVPTKVLAWRRSVRSFLECNGNITSSEVAK
jgi:hypothetical protein